MPRKLAFLILAVVLAFTLSCQERTSESKAENKATGVKSASVALKETTIRNVTKEPVKYSIKPALSPGDPEGKTLAVGAIDRYPGNKDLDIIFPRNGERIKYRLDRGMPYSFRYDENGELELYDGSHGRTDAVDLAPFVATPSNIVDCMLEMADLDEKDVLYDLGCGDGRIVITAAKRYGTRGVGIDIDPVRIQESQANARAAQVEDLVEFRLGDATKMDFSEATVVTLYLLTESNELLRPLLEAQLKPGAYVLSHNYHMPGWEEKEIDYASLQDEDGESHNIYVYKR